MTVAVIWIVVGQNRMTKINFNVGSASTYVMLRCTYVMLRFQFCVFTKISFINIFQSLAILSHVDKTKFKLSPNIPPYIHQAFPLIVEK